jgi:hypothetical protein
VCVKVLRAPWVRIASSMLSPRGFIERNGLLAESTLEAMPTQGHFHRAAKTRRAPGDLSAQFAALRQSSAQTQPPVLPFGT